MASPDGGVASLGGTPVAETQRVLRTERDAIFLSGADRLLRLVLLAAVVHNALIVVLLALAGVSTWRLLGIAIAVGTFAIVHTQVKAWILRTAFADHGFVVVSLIGQVFLGTLLTLTGGIHSPLLPVIATPIVLPALLFGPHPIGARLACSLFLMIAIVAVLPESVTGAPITTWHYGAVALTVFSWTLIMGRTFARAIRDASDAAESAIDRLRDERVHAAEAQPQRLRQVGARVAHELKNPLAAIKGLVQLVSRGADERARERLDRVQGEVARMESLLREYLSFSRPLEELALAPVDLAAIASDAVAMIAGRADGARVDVVLATRPAPVLADARWLKDALLNLLGNALDATPAGGTITVETSPTREGGAIVVRDTGRGMSEEQVVKLGKRCVGEREGGAGLGVVLAHGVVCSHGGALRFDSEVGHGTAVTITLPAKPPSAMPECAS